MIKTLSFNEEEVCIAADGSMLPGYGYQDIDYQSDADLPRSYNPLGETWEDIKRVRDHYLETGEAPDPEVRRINMRPAEASDAFGKGQPVEPQRDFEAVEPDTESDAIDLTDRAPRRPMPEPPETTVSEHIVTAATLMLDIRAQLIGLAQMAEQGTDLAGSVETREVFEQIESKAKELAVAIEAS